MKPPIIINESPKRERRGDVQWFDTVGEAEQHIEWYDIDVTHAFDVGGQFLSIRTDHTTCWLEPTGQVDKPMLLALLEDSLRGFEANRETVNTRRRKLAFDQAIADIQRIIALVQARA